MRGSSASGSASVAVGRGAERRAAQYLRERGYRILATNYRAPGGEIDIVAREGNVLAFVEVKSRAGTRCGAPEEAITPRKRARIVQAARHYLSRHPPGPEGLDLRFDVVALSKGRVRLYRGAFTLDD